MHFKSYADEPSSAHPVIGGLGWCYYLPNPTKVEPDFDNASFVSDLDRTNTPPPEDGGNKQNLKYCVECGDGPYLDWQDKCAQPNCGGTLSSKGKK